MTLTVLRHKIDQIDRQLTRLLNQRTRLALAIGALKKKSGNEIYAPEREDHVLHQVLKENRGPLQPTSLRAIYREIMSAARALQRDLVIAYLGPEMGFTHQAVAQKFGSSVRCVAYQSVADVFAAVSGHRADYGIVPVEGSIESSATHTLDLFTTSELRICGQILLTVSPSLLARIPRSRIKKIYSSQKLFSQYRLWLRRNFPRARLIPVSSIRQAAELATIQKAAAALTAPLAAQRYRLSVLESNLEDDQRRNVERFLVLGRQYYCPPTGRDKTSVLFGIPNRTGSLYRALTSFSRRKINLTKIESRPSRCAPWEYVFFVDFEGHSDERNVRAALDELRRRCSFVKVLGSYPNGS